MTPPDSGEREVMPDAEYRAALSRAAARIDDSPPISLPPSLARRILAALEACGEVVGPGMIFPRHAELAAELRALVTK